MTRPATPVVALALAGALAACGKAQETVAEKVAEKAIESSLSKDGTQAKVNLAEGGMKVSTTDASGKSTQMELGNAQISEADLGVPFYPGSKPAEGGAMRMTSNEGAALRLALHSDDLPDKVSAFYRDKLKAMAEGKQLLDMSTADGVSLSLMDDKAGSSIQVMVAKADKGSDIMISSTRAGPK